MSLKSPIETAKSASSTASYKANLSFKSMLILGFFGGAHIAFGSYFMIVVTQDASQFVGMGLSKLFGGVVFSIGLLLVSVCGAELFTGNCLMPLGILTREVPLSKLLKNWLVVYFANFLGALLLAFFVYKSGLARNLISVNILNIAVTKVNLPFVEALFRGILCNWLLVLAIWMGFSAKDVINKFICCLMPISAFVAMGFEHCIANMFFISLGMFVKTDVLAVGMSQLSHAELETLSMAGFVNNILPVTIGNIIGGAFFVGILYYMSLSKELKERK